MQNFDITILNQVISNLLNVLTGYYNEVFELTTQEIVLIIFPAIIMLFSFLYHNFTDSFYTKKLHLTLPIILSKTFISFNWITSNYGIVKIITLFIKMIIPILFIVVYILEKKEDKKSKQLCYNFFEVIFQNQNTYFSNATDFMIIFQPLKEISSFKMIKNGKYGIFHPICISPKIINESGFVAYVRKEDIADENIKYLTINSIGDKIDDFNKAISFLIQNLKKNPKIQNENLTKLMSLFVILNQTDRSFNCNFKLHHYLIFIIEHKYLINKILIFWENINLETSQNCEIQINYNLKAIKILESLIKIYPFLITKFHLKNDPKVLKHNLYLFFSQYEFFKKYNYSNLKDEKSDDILLLYFYCIEQESDLDFEKFSNTFLSILEKHE